MGAKSEKKKKKSVFLMKIRGGCQFLLVLPCVIIKRYHSLNKIKENLKHQVMQKERITFKNKRRQKKD